MAKVGEAKTIVFANVEIPKANPESVSLKSDFKKGDAIFCRIFFGKTFGDYVKESGAVSYAYRLYADGEKYAYFHSKFWNIDADQAGWVGFQDELTSKGAGAKFDALGPGKHTIEMKVYFYVPNPNKQYTGQVTGKGLEVRDASGTVDGPVAATGKFTYTV